MEEARDLAQHHDMMDVYTDLVVDVAPTQDLLKLARFITPTGYESSNITTFDDY